MYIEYRVVVVWLVSTFVTGKRSLWSLSHAWLHVMYRQTSTSRATNLSVIQLGHNDSVAAVLALVQHPHLVGVLVSEEVEVMPNLLHLSQHTSNILELSPSSTAVK